MFTNSGLSEAPPTRKPSTSGCLASIHTLANALRIILEPQALTQFATVPTADAASINYSGVLGDCGGYSLTEELSDVLVCLLGLGSRRDYARTDGPHGFVCNYDLAARSQKHRT